MGSTPRTRDSTDRRRCGAHCAERAGRNALALALALAFTFTFTFTFTFIFAFAFACSARRH